MSETDACLTSPLRGRAKAPCLPAPANTRPLKTPHILTAHDAATTDPNGHSSPCKHVLLRHTRRHLKVSLKLCSAPVVCDTRKMASSSSVVLMA